MTTGRSAPIRTLAVLAGPAQRDLVARLLSMAPDIAFCTAGDGPSGLEAAWSFRPDVILLDTGLSGFGGIELIRRYRAGGGLARILLLARTDLDWVRAAGLHAGADLVLTVPGQWGSLLSHIRLLSDGLPAWYEAALLSMGAPAGWAGLRQCALCAACLARDPAAHLKEVYIDVARRENTSPASVSKNIERLIKHLHAHSPGESWAPLGFSQAREAPSNRNFLTALLQAATFPL